MFNLDAVDWGEICITVMRDSTITLPMNTKKLRMIFSFQLSIEGLKGGHSGVDIHEDRGNAIVFSSVLDSIRKKCDIRLVSHNWRG